MRIPFTIALIIFLLTTAKGQSSLCLSTNPATGHVDFKADELASFLHLDKYRFVFFGEQHNTVFDPEIKYHLITDLNKRSGIRHVFMEMSVSGAWRCNRYLQTGDTVYLYGSPPRLTYYAYILFWKRLYDYNKSLPDAAKIIIHGVDFESTGVFPTLTELAPRGQSIPKSLKPMMDTIKAHLGDKPLHMWEVIDNKFILYDNSGFEKTLRYVQSQLLDHNADTKAYYKDNYSVVHDIATNTGRVEVKASHRDKTMFAAMEHAMKEQGIDKFVGFFGNRHTNNSIHSSLPNATKRLQGIRESDILTIAEFAYNVKSKTTAFRPKNYGELVALNGTCAATVMPASDIQGFRKECDFVIISNITE